MPGDPSGRRAWRAPVGLAAFLLLACGGGPAFAAPSAQGALHRAAKAAHLACGPTAGKGEAPWPVFGGDPSHSQDGVAVTERAGALSRKWETAPLDGALYGEALVAGGCVFVATENDSVYAFSAATGALAWRTHVASPVTSGLPCGDISPSGITGTPVLDARRGELWAVVLTAVAGKPEHEVVALGARNGKLLRRQEFALPGTDPAAEQQRGALQLGDGNVYVALGGLYGDCGNYKGAVVSVPEAAGRPLGYWSTPTAREGAVWEVGGPAVLAGGDLLFATGNSSASPGQAFDGGDAVIKLSPSLRQVSYFAPSSWAEWNVSDLDLGSMGPAVLPGGLAFQVGKAGVGFLLSVPHLGGVGGQLASTGVCNGGGAYGADAVSGSTVYVPCTGGLVAVRVAGRSIRVLWRSGAGGPGSPLVAGGRLFEETGAGELVALNPANGRVLQGLSLAAPVTHFPWVAAVGGTLYAADGTRVVALRGV